MQPTLLRVLESRLVRRLARPCTAAKVTREPSPGDAPRSAIDGHQRWRFRAVRSYFAFAVLPDYRPSCASA
jgi:hypothetical protein